MVRAAVDLNEARPASLRLSVAQHRDICSAPIRRGRKTPPWIRACRRVVGEQGGKRIAGKPRGFPWKVKEGGRERGSERSEWKKAGVALKRRKAKRLRSRSRNVTNRMISGLKVGSGLGSESRLGLRLNRDKIESNKKCTVAELALTLYPARRANSVASENLENLFYRSQGKPFLRAILDSPFPRSVCTRAYDIFAEPNDRSISCASALDKRKNVNRRAFIEA